MKRVARGTTALLGVMLLLVTLAYAEEDAARYRSPEEVNAVLADLAKQDPDSARVLTLARTPGGVDVPLIEIGPEDSSIPAILVVANAVGDCPIATEAALELAGLLLGEWKEDLAARHAREIVTAGPVAYKSQGLLSI